MSGNIVQKDDLSLLQSWSKDLFDIGQEVESVHRAIQHKRGRDAIIAQPAYESRCFPVAVWHLIDEPFALRSPAIKAGHLGGGSGLIDRSEERRVGKEGRSRWSPYHLKKKDGIRDDRVTGVQTCALPI